MFFAISPGQAFFDVTVLDPFCGVGTTLVEGQLQGYNTVGFEINPYAALAARSNSRRRPYRPFQFQNYIHKFGEYMQGDREEGPLATPPLHFNTRILFFGAMTEQKVLRAMRFIRGIRVPAIADLFSLAFGSVMVSLSNYSYEPSRSRRPHGFDAVGIHIVREKRVGASIVSSSVRQGARTTAKLYESAVVLRKS